MITVQLFGEVWWQFKKTNSNYKRSKADKIYIKLTKQWILYNLYYTVKEVLI